nr:hypothetical protein KPHV_87480 [Kitasatospora purpeofusca]
MPSFETPAERIAGDLALAIHRGLITSGEKLPSQAQLMKAYGVAMGTASSALGKLAAVGMIRTVPGSGTFAEPDGHILGVYNSNPVTDVLAAASLCRHLAAVSFPPGTETPTTYIGGTPDWDDPHADPDRVLPPQRLDVSALVALDRHLLRWMSEAYLTAARRLIGSGQSDADVHLVESARALLRSGGRRPESQPGIAVAGGPYPDDEDVALRIWPERRTPDRPADWGGPHSDEPPF